MLRLAEARARKQSRKVSWIGREDAGNGGERQPVLWSRVSVTSRLIVTLRTTGARWWCGPFYRRGWKAERRARPLFQVPRTTKTGGPEHGAESHAAPQAARRMGRILGEVMTFQASSDQLLGRVDIGREDTGLGGVSGEGILQVANALKVVLASTKYKQH